MCLEHVEIKCVVDKNNCKLKDKCFLKVRVCDFKFKFKWLPEGVFQNIPLPIGNQMT